MLTGNFPDHITPHAFQNTKVSLMETESRSFLKKEMSYTTMEIFCYRCMARRAFQTNTVYWQQREEPCTTSLYRIWDVWNRKSFYDHTIISFFENESSILHIRHQASIFCKKEGRKKTLQGIQIITNLNVSYRFSVCPSVPIAIKGLTL